MQKTFLNFFPKKNNKKYFDNRNHMKKYKEIFLSCAQFHFASFNHLTNFIQGGRISGRPKLTQA